MVLLNKFTFLFSDANDKIKCCYYDYCNYNLLSSMGMKNQARKSSCSKGDKEDNKAEKEVNVNFHMATQRTKIIKKTTRKLRYKDYKDMVDAVTTIKESTTLNKVNVIEDGFLMSHSKTFKIKVFRVFMFLIFQIII